MQAPTQTHTNNAQDARRLCNTGRHSQALSSQLEASYKPFGTELPFGMRVRIDPVQRVVQHRFPFENRSTAVYAVNHPQIPWWV